MSDNLRSKVIRLAHQQPALRPHLLPLLMEGSRVAAASVSDEDMDALRDYASKHGKLWKSKLLKDWASGKDAGQYGGALRRIRDAVGPNGLKSLKLEK